MGVSAIILGDNQDTLGGAAEPAVICPEVSPDLQMTVEGQPWTFHRAPCPPPSSPVLADDQLYQDPGYAQWLESVMSVSAIILGDDTLDSTSECASSDLDS